MQGMLESGGFKRLVVQYHQLGSFESQGGEGAAIIVCELDFEHACSEILYDGSDLSAAKLAVGQILGQRHYVQEFDRVVHIGIPISKARNSSSTAGSLPHGG